MEKCFNCGISEIKAILFDVVLPEGIMKICGKCSAEKNMPLIKGGFSPQNEKKQTVYERLSKISGIDLSKQKDDEEKKHKTFLRNVVDSNFEKNFRNDLNAKENLIDNFHWAVMRARRSKKLTQEQFAEAIQEPTKAIILIEKGFVPEEKAILNKIENYLGIRIKKNNWKTEQGKDFLSDSSEIVQNSEDKKKQLTDFNFKDVKNLTIADLQEMKKRKEDNIL